MPTLALLHFYAGGNTCIITGHGTTNETKQTKISCSISRLYAGLGQFAPFSHDPVARRQVTFDNRDGRLLAAEIF